MVDGLRYRAPMFRQLNTRIAPDRAFWDGAPPARGSGYFAAFVEVCNVSDRARRPPEGFRLLDSFGQAFRPKDTDVDNEFAYEPRKLAPDECIPAGGSVADQAVVGSVLLFELPFDVLRDRPLYLRLPPPADSDAAPPRIRLDV